MFGWTWANPWAFLLLPLVLGLPLQRYLTGRLRMAVPSLDDMRRGWTLRLLLAWVPGFAQVLGLLLVVIALARPQEVRREVMLESEGLDIILAVDTSGSMRQDDLTSGLQRISRLELAKGVISEFVEGRPNDRIGLVAFDSGALTVVPLTLDHGMLQAALRQVNIGQAGGQKTAIGLAIAIATKRLKDLEVEERIVILLTDGNNTAGMPPMQAAEAAKALGVKVYAIGVGRPRRSLFGVMDDGIDEKGLTRIAEMTGGRFFRAVDAEALKRVYDTINELEPSTAEVRELLDVQERYRWFLIPGFLLLVLHQLLSSTWLRRGP